MLEITQDGELHQFCESCGAEALDETRAGGKTSYRCRACGAVLPRAIIIDPGVVWWSGEDWTYWHESAGVLIRDDDHRILFFERTKYPPGITVPAGHVDRGEHHRETALREAREEVSVVLESVHLIAEADIANDSCRRGSDHHRWHLYEGSMPANGNVVVTDEGHRPVWLAREEALERPLIVPVRWFLERMDE
ncbi:MAG: NUDIX hydrolase [Thermoanaerobaculia bacterium]